MATRLLIHHVSRLEEGHLSRRWNASTSVGPRNLTGRVAVNGLAARWARCPMTTDSSKRGSMVNGGSHQVDEPMGLADALRERYVSPWRRIYERVTGRRKQPMSGGGGGAGGHQEERQLPNSIAEAWRMGMQGTHPSRFSGLRARASTPLHTPCSPSMAAGRRETGPISQAVVTPASDADDHQYDDTSHGTWDKTKKKKKSLLQSYLDLDKRSQKIISLSVFIWSLSGVIYFTWFSPLPAASPPSSKNLLLSSSSSHRHQSP